MDNGSLYSAGRRTAARHAACALGLMAVLLLLGGCADRIEADITIRPDGSWAGETRLTFGAPPAALPGWQAELDARVEEGAAGLLDGRGIVYSLCGTTTENEQVVYRWQVAGEKAGALAGLLDVDALDAAMLAGRLSVTLGGRVRAGQEMDLALPANPSTGYAWQVVDGMDGRLVQVGDITSRPLAAVPGALARQVVRFRAVADGPASVRLDYRRPWQPDEVAGRLLTVQSSDQELGQVMAWLSMPARPAIQESLPAVELAVPSAGPVPPKVYSLNWCNLGGCTPVKDQGGCGGCWAFSTVGVMESAVKLGSGVTRDLSEQYLVSCNGEGWGCGGGWYAHDYHDWKFVAPQTRAGAVLESAFPYQAGDVPCGGSYSHPYHIESWAYVNPGSPFAVPPVNAIRQALADRGPLSVAVCAGNDFGAYTGGVFGIDESAECEGGINHAVVLVGWNDEEQSWTLRNSWGPGWGEGGYMRIRWNTSNVGYGASYVAYDGEPPVFDHHAYLPLAKRAY